MSDFLIEPLAAKHVEAAFDLATEVFVAGSSLHRALDIGLVEYRTYLRPSFEVMVAEGLSLVAVEADGGRIAGCLIATDYFGGERGEVPNKFQPLQALGRELAEIYAQHRTFAKGQVALVDMAAVAPWAMGQGLYKRLREAGHRQAKRQGFQYVVGELSSAVTQHVVVGKLGHKVVGEIAFAEFEIPDGSRPFALIKEPKSMILTEERI